jgi:ethanolamine utilization protein EutN
MILGKVTACVVATLKHPAFKRYGLLVVRPLTLAGDLTKTSVIVAINAAQAGIGDTVLVNQEGKSARAIVGIKDAPIRSVIVGVVDHWDENGKIHSAGK